MAEREALTSAYVRSILDYNPETGGFTWREREDVPREWNKRYAGVAASCDSGNGYVRIKIRGKSYLAHRLAWLHTNGEWPAADVDHINMNRSDNRLANLREASRSENMWNIRKPSTNTSGLKGVSWSKTASKWRASIAVNGRSRYICYSDCPAAASFAYQIYADKHHGGFARA